MAKFQRKTKEERCKEIMTAAKTVFLKKGYRYTTMEDIIAQTSLSKGGVYQYYKSTKAIMFDIMSSSNYFRYRRTEEIINKLLNSDDICEIITQTVIAKLFEKIPEKKLYVMFLSEIMYDKESEQLFYKLEKQAHDLFLQNFKDLLNRQNISGKENIQFKMDKIKLFSHSISKLYSRIFNGIIIIYELLNDKTPFDTNENEIHNFVYNIIKKIIE